MTRTESERPGLNAMRPVLCERSNYSVDETVERLKRTLQAKEVNIFAIIDRSGEAENLGFKMPPTKLVIFGSPKAGTPLMLAAPSIAIDLPLKILSWEDARGKVWVSTMLPPICRSGTAYLKTCCKI